MGVAALALHGIHDSVLISGRKSVIICVMLDYFLFYRVEESTEALARSLAYKGFKQFRRGSSHQSGLATIKTPLFSHYCID